MSKSKDNSNMREYKCTRTVHAAQIQSVVLFDGHKTGKLVCPAVDPKEDGPQEFIIELPVSWFERHRPQAGGYVVQYKDGYISYSPADAFEDGHREIKARAKKG